MSPVMIEVIALALVKYGPSVAMALVEIFERKTATRDDWAAVFALARKDYDDYVRSE